MAGQLIDGCLQFRILPRLLRNSQFEKLSAFSRGESRPLFERSMFLALRKANTQKGNRVTCARNIGRRIPRKERPMLESATCREIKMSEWSGDTFAQG
jgi:hypothetical protein